MAIRTDYQIAVIDSATGTTLDIITPDRWRRLQYTRILNGVGTFVLTLPVGGNARVLSYFTGTDNLYEIYRRNIGGGALAVEETYLSRQYEIFSDEDGEDWIIISGVSLEHFLKRRIINLDDDPNSAGGYLTYQDVGSQILRDLVFYQLISPATNTSRTLSGLGIGTVSGGSTTYIRERFGASLWDVMRKVVDTGDIDFDVTRTTGLNFEFHATTVGSDRTQTTNFGAGQPYVLFTPLRGNIIEPAFGINRTDEVNSVWVLGQGPDNDRERLLQQRSTTTDSAYNLIEGTTDARDIQGGVTDGLIAAGQEFLSENKAKQTFEFAPDLRLQGAQYNVDWFLGDIVTATYEGFSDDLRIERIKVQIDDDESIAIELDNENVD